jgi:hypothetical protein
VIVGIPPQHQPTCAPIMSTHYVPPRLRGRQLRVNTTGDLAPGCTLRVNTTGGLAPGCTLTRTGRCTGRITRRCTGRCTLTRTRRCRREASRSVPGTAPQGCCAVSHTHSRVGDARRVEHPPRGSRAGARWTRHSSWHTARRPSQMTNPGSRSGRWYSPSCRTARRTH